MLKELLSNAENFADAHLSYLKVTQGYVTNIFQKNGGFCSNMTVFKVNTRRKLNIHLTFITA